MDRPVIGPKCDIYCVCFFRSADDVATAILKRKERPNRLIGSYTFDVSILPSLYHGH